jgi:ABC-2 type transport system ATP-binding protein
MTVNASPHAIRVEGLQKNFGDVLALQGVDFAVPTGTVLGLLGPNGAGKTTAVRVLTTILRPDAGLAEVLGVDVTKDPQGVRERIGLAGQYAAVDENLTGHENLRMVGKLTHMPKALISPRADELLAQFDLVDAATRPVRTYSGGMRRRLDLAAALVHRPPILFLDEPTTGLDPQSRRALWDTIASLRDRGKTVVLTTHYMDEAERLCDRVAIVDHGKRIALGTPSDLIDQLGGHHLIELATEPPLSPEALAGLPGVRAVRVMDGGGNGGGEGEGAALSLSIEEPHVALPALVARLGQRAVRPTRLMSRTATLDDVFLSLTGRTLREG